MDWNQFINSASAAAQGFGALWSVFFSKTLPGVFKSIITWIKASKSVPIKTPIFVSILLLLVISSFAAVFLGVLQFSPHSENLAFSPKESATAASTETADISTSTIPATGKSIQTYRINKQLSCTGCTLLAPDIRLTSISLDKTNRQTLFYLRITISSNATYGDEFQIPIFTLTGSNGTPEHGDVDWGSKNFTKDGNLAVSSNDVLQVTEKFSSFTLSQGSYELDVSTELLTSAKFTDNFDSIQLVFDGNGIKTTG